MWLIRASRSWRAQASLNAARISGVISLALVSVEEESFMSRSFGSGDRRRSLCEPWQVPGRGGNGL
ncbi:hypothetical protein [Rathayibacter sp. VKM Ac-2630]|uniref:hypothetical protein n=1 Tax=Rathayibacter sp. VKM Ac-2630 TaxID=1938617 RepID=UPI001F1B6156|nr:hypothetical protein [Rathayibacter sp. VKM Ac-2630]